VSEYEKDSNRCLRDIAERLDRLQEDLSELKSAWDKHVSDYGDLLKATKVSAEEKLKLRNAIIEKSLSSAIWGVMVFLAIAAWTYLRDHTK